jgi:mannonate dehydratase
MTVMTRPKDLSEASLRYTRQIGVDDVQVYLPEVPGYKEKRYLTVEALQPIQERIASFGLRLSRLHLGQGDLTHLLLGRPDWRAELDNVCRTIETMGRAGVPVLMYSLLASRAILTETKKRMPGYWANPDGRGGARLQSFDEGRARADSEEPAGRITRDQMWERITRFVERCAPVAERSGVFLACHPDDPPIARHWGIEQVLIGMDALRRLAAIVASRHHGLLLCQGTIQESGVDVLEYIRTFGLSGRIAHVELRGVVGTVPKYDEVFMDQGDLSLWKVVRALKEVGYAGVLEVAHVPRLIDDPDGMRSATWAVGFLKGLIAAAEG